MYITWKRFEKTKNSVKVKNFAGINFRGWKILKDFAELTFAEKAKKRETAKVSDLKVLLNQRPMY